MREDVKKSGVAEGISREKDGRIWARGDIDIRKLVESREINLSLEEMRGDCTRVMRGIVSGQRDIGFSSTSQSF
jgi:hypothetical protein